MLLAHGAGCITAQSRRKITEDGTTDREFQPSTETAAALPTGYSGQLWNKGLAPRIPRDSRTWGTYNYAALWVAMSVNIPTYMLASAMIAGGMNWRQALGTVFLGNVHRA